VSDLAHDDIFVGYCSLLEPDLKDIQYNAYYTNSLENGNSSKTIKCIKLFAFLQYNELIIKV